MRDAALISTYSTLVRRALNIFSQLQSKNGNMCTYDEWAAKNNMRRVWCQHTSAANTGVADNHGIVVFMRRLVNFINDCLTPVL